MHQENTSYQCHQCNAKKIAVEKTLHIKFVEFKTSFAELLAQTLFQNCNFVIGAHI